MIANLTLVGFKRFLLYPFNMIKKYVIVESPKCGSQEFKGKLEGTYLREMRELQIAINTEGTKKERNPLIEEILKIVHFI